MITQQQEQFQDLQVVLQVAPDSAFYHFWTGVFFLFSLLQHYKFEL